MPNPNQPPQHENVDNVIAHDAARIAVGNGVELPGPQLPDGQNSAELVDAVMGQPAESAGGETVAGHLSSGNMPKTDLDTARREYAEQAARYGRSNSGQTPPSPQSHNN